MNDSAYIGPGPDVRSRYDTGKEAVAPGDESKEQDASTQTVEIGTQTKPDDDDLCPKDSCSCRELCGRSSLYFSHGFYSWASACVWCLCLHVRVSVPFSLMLDFLSRFSDIVRATFLSGKFCCCCCNCCEQTESSQVLWHVSYAALLFWYYFWCPSLCCCW